MVPLPEMGTFPPLTLNLDRVGDQGVSSLHKFLIFKLSSSLRSYLQIQGKRGLVYVQGSLEACDHSESCPISPASPLIHPVYEL